MKKIKNPIEFLLDNGLIFEFNRQILHPIGLSLEADIQEDDDGKQEFCLFLWECPENDRDGFLFPDDSFELGSAKYNKLLNSKKNRVENRKTKLGFLIQEQK